MKSRILISLLSIIAYFTNCYAQTNNLQLANGFMNEMRTFLIEEGFSPKLEDDYLNFKKEGVGYHLQITGTGPYIYQFYVDAVEMPPNMDLNRLLVDINSASSIGALIHTVYQDGNDLAVSIRVAGATRSAEDFKYVFYAYLTGLQVGYHQALSYADNPGKNYPNPDVVYSNGGGIKITNVFTRSDVTIIDFEYTNQYLNDGNSWITIDPKAAIIVGNKEYTLINAEGINISPQITYLQKDNNKVNFRLYFPPLPENTTRFDFIESQSSPWRILGIQLK